MAVWYVLVYLLAATGVWLHYRNIANDRSITNDDNITNDCSIANNSRRLTAVGKSTLDARTSRGLLAPGYSDINNPALNMRLAWLWGMLLVLSLSCVHAIYWTDMRMRAVAMPVVALAAAAGASRREQS